MLERYINLSRKVDSLVESGRNDLAPEIRSMCRQLTKLYRKLAPEERQIADYINNIHYC